MRIPDKELLAAIRAEKKCAWCGRPGYVEAAHIFAKGMGNAWQMDLRINVLPLGGFPGCCCHIESHRGRMSRSDLLAVVAARTGLLQREIETALFLLRRLPYRKPEEVQRLHREHLEYWGLLTAAGVPSLAGRCCGLEGVKA